MNLARPQTLFDVKGKVALITGASGAFGAVAAQTLFNAEAEVVLAAGNASALAETASKCGDAIQLNTRPSTESDCEAMVADTVAAHGRLDILVVASGMNKVAKIEEMDPATFYAVMDANVTQSWLLARAATT